MIEKKIVPNGMEKEFDVSLAIDIFLRRKWLILMFTLVCAGAAVVAVLLLPNEYESVGVLQFGSLQTERVVEPEQTRWVEFFRYGQSIPEYRRLESRLMNPELFCDLLSAETSLPAEKKAEISSNLLMERMNLAHAIDPLYASSRDDTRLFGGTVLGKDETNSVIGFKLRWRDTSPRIAQNMVFFLARHIKSQIAYDTLQRHISRIQTESAVQIFDLDNIIIQARFTLERLNKKLEEIRMLMKRYPGVDALGNHQVVSIQEGGYRYLPPANQAVGVESEITDIKQELLITERSRNVSERAVEFYNNLLPDLEKEPGGEFLLARYDDLVKKLGKDLNSPDDVTREFYNLVTVRNEEFKRTLLSSYRFISEPNLPSRHIKPRRGRIVLISTFFSFIIIVLWVFANHFLGAGLRVKKASQET